MVSAVDIGGSATDVPDFAAVDNGCLNQKPRAILRKRHGTIEVCRPLTIFGQRYRLWVRVRNDIRFLGDVGLSEQSVHLRNDEFSTAGHSEHCSIDSSQSILLESPSMALMSI